MEIEGIDRVVIGVKDMDKALELFGRLFGIRFTELKGPIFEQGRVRVSISLDHHLELISPIPPVQDINPPDTLTLAKWLEERGDGVLFALALKVKDARGAAVEAEQNGVRVCYLVEEARNDSLSIQNFKEAILDENDTLGIKIALAQWERPV
jgi:catechol 2,3-dioxygenase-like lactoylglutathione lyase family enzyme